MDFKKLTADLKNAVINANAHCNDDDWGTCNFDTCVLFEKGIRFDFLKKAVNDAGLNVSKWIAGEYHIFGYEWGQANRRTNMVEAFTDTLKKLGYNVFVYYAMD